jgi:hypothetical protein
MGYFLETLQLGLFKREFGLLLKRVEGSMAIIEGIR